MLTQTEKTSVASLREQQNASQAPTPITSQVNQIKNSFPQTTQAVYGTSRPRLEAVYLVSLVRDYKRRNAVKDRIKSILKKPEKQTSHVQNRIQKLLKNREPHRHELAAEYMRTHLALAADLKFHKTGIKQPTPTR